MSLLLNFAFIALCVLLTNVFIVHCQLHRYQVKTARQSRSDDEQIGSDDEQIEIKAEKIIAKAMKDVMRSDIQLGLTPEYCGPNMACGYSNRTTAQFVLYCRQCTGDYYCDFFQTDINMEFNVFTCQPVKPRGGRADIVDEGSGVKDRRGAMPHIHEL